MPVEIRVPVLGESVVEATVGKWLKQVGDTIERGDALVELETDKVNLEVPAEQGGVLETIAKEAGATVGVGEVLGMLGEGQGSAEQAPTAPSAENGAQAAPPPPATVAATGAAERMQATPVARRLAGESQVDLAQVRGTGPGGRITKQDVVSAGGQGAVSDRTDPANRTDRTIAAPMTPAPSPAVVLTPPVPAMPSLTAAQPDRERRERLSRRRQTIARRLVEAQHTAAMLTTFNEVDMSAIMEVRKRRRDSFKERHGIGLGFMSFFTKASIGALKAYPRLNAEIQGDEIVLKSYYDIGIAVSTDEGLVVPVVRDADRRSFADLERAIADLAGRARAGTLTLPDLQGGSFTITNGGVFGSLLSTPILNAPQVGILGMHKIEERPIALAGQVVIRPMMYLALSYDHRIVDGSESVRFLVRIKELLEDPESLLLEG